MLSRTLAAVGGMLLAALPVMAGSSRIKGDYVEARNADVFTGPCFSNAQVFITGKQAVMAWKVSEGRWDGVDLKGLTIAAAVSAETTFSEDRPELAKCVLIVDERADSSQREALIKMAKALGRGRLDHVVAVRESRMVLTVEHDPATASGEAHGSISNHAAGQVKGHGMPKAELGSFWAPGLAEIATRPLTEDDHLCGNEVVAYEPLSKGVEALPAFTRANTFKGAELDVKWTDPNCRSSFVGHFSY